MKNSYYVYVHLNPETNRAFYIGKGINDRAYSHKGRNLLWYKYINATESDHRVLILMDGLSEKQALKLEEKIIAKLGIVPYGGRLVNIVGLRSGIIEDISLEKLFIEEYENQFKGYSDSEIIDELLNFSNWDYGLKLEKEFQHIFDSFHVNYDYLKQISDPEFFWVLEDLLDQIQYEFLFDFKHNSTSGVEFYEELAFIESDLLALLNQDNITKNLRSHVSKTHVWISHLLDSPNIFSY